MATDLCNIKTSLDLTALDLSCLVSFCSSTGAAPTTKTLAAVLDFIVKKVCCLNTKVDNINVSSGSSYTEPNLTLPTCLQYTDPTSGQTVTQLQLNAYTLRLGNQFCDLKATVTTHTSQITSLTTRVTSLENAPTVTLPTVVPNCLLTPGTPAQMNVLLDELESQYCLLRNVLGTNTSITTAVAQQCANLGASSALSQSGTVSGLPGWNATTTNLAQSFQNLWVVVCDMRQTIYDLKNQSGTTDCSAFLLGFTAAANSDRSQVTLFFNGGGTVVPAGYTNCNAQGSKVTIKDASNHTYTGYVDLTTAVSNSSGVTFTITSASLNTAQAYTVTVEGCLTKSGNQCSKTAVQTISIPCPVITGITATLQ
jgi:hypothetical protein